VVEQVTALVAGARYRPLHCPITGTRLVDPVGCGFGRIVGSEIEAPNMLVNLV
jgi:hypothetical protein